MKKILPLVILAFLFSTYCQGQEISTFVAENALGSTLLDSGVDIDFDSDGNIIVYGFFDDDLDFDLGSGEMIVDPLGSPDLFLAKYTSTGELLWVVNIGRISLIDGMINGELKIDTDDNILITGGFANTVNFNPLGEAVTASSSGGADAFVAKYNSDGLVIWLKTIGGASTDLATSIDVTDDGTSAFGVRFNGNIDADPGEGEEILTNAGAQDGAVIALDVDGNYLFSYHIGTLDNDNITALKFATDGKLAVGSTINGVTSGFPDRDMQLSYHENSGALIWAHNFSNFDDANEISNILFSQDELNMYIGGRINGTTDFDPDAESEVLIDPVFADPFLAKYDLSGNLVWARFVSSAGTNDYFSGMAEAGSALFTQGSFDVVATFVEGDFSTQRPSSGGQDIYIAAYDRFTGDFIEADVYGGSNDEFAKVSAFKEDGRLLCTGSYSNTLNLNPDGEPIESIGFTDAFFAEFSYQTDLSDGLGYESLENLKVFPNPVSETVHLQIPQKIAGNEQRFKLIDVVGQVVKKGYFVQGVSHVQLDVSDLNKGVYILELTSGSQKVSKRIIKQ